MWSFLLLAVAIGQAAPSTERDPADNAAIVYRGYFAEIEAAQKSSQGMRELLSKPVAELSKDQLPVVAKRFPPVEKPYCDWGIDYSEGPFALMTHAESARPFARSMQASARVSASEGRTEEAVEGLVNCYRFARDMAMDSTVISFLYRVQIEKETSDAAAQIMASLSSEERRGLLDEHQKLLANRNLKTAILLEKEFNLGWLRRNIQKNPAGAWRKKCRVLSGDAREVDSLLARSEAARNLKELDSLIESYDKIAEIIDQPTKEAAAKIDDLMQNQQQGNRWAKFLPLGFRRLLLKRDQLQATSAMLAAAVDLLEHGEGAIVKHADPFGNGPFRLTTNEGEWVLESALDGGDGKPVMLRVWR